METKFCACGWDDETVVSPCGAHMAMVRRMEEIDLAFIGKLLIGDGYLSAEEWDDVVEGRKSG